MLKEKLFTKELFTGAETSTGAAQRESWPGLGGDSRDHLMGSSGNSLGAVKMPRRLIPSNFLIIPSYCTCIFVLNIL